MSEAQIPPEVLRFVDQCIDTVPHLEALLLMWESAPQVWTDAALAPRLYVNVPMARRILTDLERRGLIASVDTGDGTTAHRIAHKDDPLITQVAQTYRRQLIPMARYIHSKGSPAMREFSRAFQIKDK